MHRHEYDDVRFRNLQQEVLQPAVRIGTAPCEVSVWQTDLRCGSEDVRDQAFVPVDLGWRWGPVWSTAWFRVRCDEVPDGEAPLALSFSSGTEALLWLDGAPYQGLDINHPVAYLPAWPGEVLVEAACNLPLGVSTFWWDEAELRARWREAAPGRLDEALLIRVDQTMVNLVHRWDFARRLMLAFPRDADRAQQVAKALHQAAGVLDLKDPRSHAAQSLEILNEALASGTPAQTQCVAIGHAHIDTAWLWPLAETKRKCARTFATMLRHMERDDSFIFLCTQPQQYAWIEEAYPTLFDQIRDRVSEGRWDASGAMWVEPDCLIPSGESLIRQLIRGVGWWSDRFGDSAPQRHLFLPDTFGFPASLPQIAVKAGLDVFITNKIAWNEVNDFPHVTFRWRGIDGTDIVGHMTPGHNYNSEIAPSDLLAATRNVVELDHGEPSQWLQPFGYGDGGGGPTELQIDRVHASAACGGLPQTRFGRVDMLCDQLLSSTNLPVWDGELYMEGHRGIYTSQRWLKQANLQLEESLRLAEILSGSKGDDSIRQAWDVLLLNQFHDILPGSSIREVYEESNCQMTEAQSMVESCLAKHVCSGDRVFNPSSTARSGVVNLHGKLHWIDGVPPLTSTRPIDHLPSSVKPVRAAQRALDNGLVRVEFDDMGQISMLRGVDSLLPVNMAQDGHLHVMNALRLYEDHPRQWDAWNLDHDYASAPVSLDGPISITLTDEGPLRGQIEVTRSIGSSSHLVMRYTLDAGARRLDVEVDIEWQEDRRVLRVVFPTGIRTRQATCGIQFGSISRPTHANTSWEQAQFEVPGHRWVDVSEPGRGLAILDEAIYGRSIESSDIGLTLLRAPEFPDPTADRGNHTMRWSLMPHGGDHRSAGVDAEAESLTRRFITGVGEVHAPFRIESIGPVAIEIAALKPAEDGRGRILRLVEKHGGHGTAVLRFPKGIGAVTSCDLLERPSEDLVLIRDSESVRLPMRPFGIVSLRIEDGE